MSDPATESVFWSTVLLALFSGFIGSAVGLAPWLKQWVDRPQLATKFAKAIQGCDLPDVEEFNRTTGAVVGRRKYLRLCVENNGRSEAKEVQVIVGRIAFEKMSSFLDHEVINARWSRAKGSIRV